MKRMMCRMMLAAALLLCICLSASCDAPEDPAPACEHVYGDWTVTAEPDCTVEGSQTRVCANCGESEVAPIARAAHQLSAPITHAPTCKEQGFKEAVCTVCGHAERGDYTPTAAHQWSIASVQAPTCEAQGCTEYLCTACGDTKTADYLPTLGHDMAAWQVTVAAACLDAGTETRSCSRCSHSETRSIAPIGHSMQGWVTVNAPSCLDAGMEKRACVACTHSETRSVAALGHDHGITSVVSATCTERGYTVYSCARCSDSYRDTYTAILPHSFGGWQVDSPAACTTAGTECRQCTGCGHSETRSIAPIGHSMQGWVTVNAPSCLDAGAEKRACGVCAHEETRTLPALGHDYSDTWLTPPTCTTEGYTGHACTRCYDSYTDTVVPATGVHTYSKWSTLQPATCLGGGVEVRSCSQCLRKETRPVAQMGHQFSIAITETRRCARCGLADGVAYTGYVDFAQVCTVSESSGVVTMRYNGTEAVTLNLHLFALDSSKQYVFRFGTAAHYAKIAGNGLNFRNVRIVIDKRDTAFDLVLASVGLGHQSTVLQSDAHTLRLGLFGSGVYLRTHDGSNGSNGENIGTFQIGNGGRGGNGGNASVPVICNGVLEITCGTNAELIGGNGGRGGNGGNSKSSGGIGGDGGNGGNGAMAISANVIRVGFANGKTRANLVILGGSGGAGGSGGDGTGAFWLPNGINGANGHGGSSATATNISIEYLP